MSDWVTDNRGEGPWDFVEQPEKLGYINNPLWTDAPASDVEHEPCGYWFKGSVPPSPTTGPLWGAGVNEYGQLGIRSQIAWGSGQPYTPPDFNFAGNPCVTPFREVLGATWARTAMGQGHSVHVHSDGTLWTTGLGNNGRLGLGDLVTYHYLKQVGTDTDWAYATCGYNSTWALKTNGTLWCCGYNLYGDLGLGDYVDRNVFTQVPGAWASVSSGSAHTFALKSDGTLWSCGRNHYGQLGLGVADATFPPPNNTFTQAGGASNWVKVSCGRDHTLALDSNGNIFATGYNGTGYSGLVYGGQLGLGNTIDRASFTLTGNGTSDWTDVKAGPSYSVAIKGNGQSAWVTGESLYGEMGLGLIGPIPGTEAQYSKRIFTQIPDLPPFKQIQPGFLHMMYIGTDNSLWGTGHNAYGELGFDPGGAHTDQYYGAQPSFIRIGTERNWLRLWESGFFASSVAIRTPFGNPVVDVSDRPSPIWTMPTT